MKEFEFSPAIAEQVQNKLRVLRELQHSTNEWLKGVMQAHAAANGAGPNDEIQLWEDAGGIIVFEASERTPAKQEEEPPVYEPELHIR